MAVIVRAEFQCSGGRQVKLTSRAPAFAKLSATARHFIRHDFSCGGFGNGPGDRSPDAGPAAGVHLGGGVDVHQDATIPGDLGMQVPGRKSEIDVAGPRSSWRGCGPKAASSPSRCRPSAFRSMDRPGLIPGAAPLRACRHGGPGWRAPVCAAGPRCA